MLSTAVLRDIFIGVVLGLAVALGNNYFFVKSVNQAAAEGGSRAGTRAVTKGFLVKMGIDALAVVGVWIFSENVVILLSAVFGLTILGNFALYQMVFGKGGK